MKYRSGFVSNSSSTIFVVTNKTTETLTVGDFVKETAVIMAKGFHDEYAPDTPVADIQNQLLKEAECIKDELEPGRNIVEFGDNHGPYSGLVGDVYDYMARAGGESIKFKWAFLEYNR